MKCSVCGQTEFAPGRALWPKLISDWQLAPHEVDYIDAQQAKRCTHCGANLRSIALGQAIQAFANHPAPLMDPSSRSALSHFDVLEINEAGTLTPVLRQLPRYTFGAYPEVDMLALPFVDGQFDLVVHSDTLEHIPNPVRALAECLRVLKPAGALAFTIPIIVGRMSRDRSGLPKSHHGQTQTDADDYVVHTEFGADFWTYLMQAGFSRVEIHAVEHPAGLAILARK